MIKRPASKTDVSVRILITYIVMIILAAIVGSGCMSSREHAMKAKTSDLINELRYRRLVVDSSMKVPIPFQYEINIPGFKLNTVVNPLLRAGDTIRVVDSTTQSQLRYWINRAGQLEIECAQKDRTEQKTDTLYKEVPIPTVVKMPVAWYETNYAGAIFGGLIVLFVVWAVSKAGGKPPNIPPTPLVLPVEPA